MADTKTLLIEAGIEEAPSWFIQGALEALPGIVAGLLEREKLGFQDTRVIITPRRIALIVRGLALRQQDETKQVTGPPAKIGVGPDGRFLPPAVKFAEKQGGSEKDLAVIETEKGTYVAVKVHRSGLPAAEIVSRIVPEIFSEKTLPHQKSMRWGEGTGPFIRPVHWLVVLLGDDLVRCSLFGVGSDRFSMGHRFHSSGKIEIESPESYEETLLRRGRVVVDQQKRRDMIRKQLHEEASAAGGVLLENQTLEEEVTNLVEWPVVIRGRFDEKFLDLPRDIIITVMARHQRYFAVKEAAQEKLLPCFLAVANTDPALKQGAAGDAAGIGAARSALVKGYERVLTARFEDAGFFFAEDKKKKLSERLEALRGIVFQRGAGDYYQKAMRLEKLAAHIARTIRIESVGFGGGMGELQPLSPDDIRRCSRAALLSKADLASSMVFELPELQGVMGGVYARNDSKYEEEEAKGISEHYLPASVSDPLPSSITGVVVSLADKIDSLMTFIALGHRPSSASDPLGFRRLCLGIIRLVAEKQLRLDLRALAKAALDLVREDVQQKDVKKKDEDPVEFLMGFIKDRLKVYWKDAARPDFLDAVLEVDVADIVKARKRLDALLQFKETPLFKDLAVAFKRAYRISRELEGMQPTDVNPGLFAQIEEKVLYDAIIVASRLIKPAYEQEDYALVFGHFSDLRYPIDIYFNKVFVNDENEEIKRNRLATLKMIVDLIVPAARLDLIQFERTKLPGLADMIVSNFDKGEER